MSRSTRSKRKTSDDSACISPKSCSSMNDNEDKDYVRNQVNAMLLAAGVGETDPTVTKAGWCLREGLCHVGSLDEARLLPRIIQHGVPTFYQLLSDNGDRRSKQCRHDATQDLKDPQTCFQSLCRIVVGQCVHGRTAQAVWKRLNELAQDSSSGLVPQDVLKKAGTASQLTQFQKTVGVTHGKAKCLVDLAQHFADEDLTEEMLQRVSEDEVRTALLKVKGIGEWTCHMFLLFFLERSNVLPLGDLGVLKGITAHFFTKSGSTKSTKKLVSAKKNGDEIHHKLQNYAPYHSLVAYYMWRVADTPADSNAVATAGATPAVTERVDSNAEIAESPSQKKEATTPSRKRTRHSLKSNTVTP